jgi:hypothetical protein
MSLKTRLFGALFALTMTSGLGAASAHAQPATSVGGSQKVAQAAPVRAVTVSALSARRCDPNYWHISGNGVRIRQTPGGTAVGHANYGERVDIWARNGVWVRVYFKNRPLYVHPRSGWVHQDYVEYRQPTCW